MSNSFASALWPFLYLLLMWPMPLTLSFSQRTLSLPWFCAQSAFESLYKMGVICVHFMCKFKNCFKGLVQPADLILSSFATSFWTEIVEQKRIHFEDFFWLLFVK